MSVVDPSPVARRNDIIVRTIGLFLLWTVLAGPRVAEIAAGLPTALAAGLVSVRLLPPSQGTFRWLALLPLIARFLQQSVVAGADVAWRALDPRLPLQPGFVTYRTGLPEGPPRHAFTTLMSLLPGTVPVRSDATDGLLIIHCLDASQPVARQLAAEEARFVAVAGAPRPHV